MPDIVESTMKLFADDAKIFKAIESFDDINVIQDDIDSWTPEMVNRMATTPKRQ